MEVLLEEQVNRHAVCALLTFSAFTGDGDPNLRRRERKTNRTDIVDASGSKFTPTLHPSRGAGFRGNWELPKKSQCAEVAMTKRFGIGTATSCWVQKNLGPQRVPIGSNSRRPYPDTDEPEMAWIFASRAQRHQFRTKRPQPGKSDLRLKSIVFLFQPA